MCRIFPGYSETILRFVQLVQLLLIVTRPSFAGYVSEIYGQDDNNPRFDAIISGIEARIAETVLLPCTVRNTGDKVVSWMRRKDLSILTSGDITFSADSRFESVHNLEADFWGLRIRGVRLSDAGQYECQVNTDPKMNLAVNLSIIESSVEFSRAQIKSPKEVSARQGSTLSLTCEITGEDTQPLMKKARVRWLHESKEITSKFDDGGISIETDYHQGRICSTLIINLVQQKHSGKYTCTQYAAKEDSVKLRVIDDVQFYMEAMQRDSAYSSASSSTKNSMQIFTFCIYLLFFLH
ncbi:contactin-3-like [Atheta coriaria]|uniref:contactin-3-like n=1 Tax=Dalotia coriaria TaxID=877792 RepID=UPI0031F43616